MQGFVHNELARLGKTQDSLECKALGFAKSEKEIVAQAVAAKEDMNQVLEEIKILREEVKHKVGEGLNGLSVAAGRISAEVVAELGLFHTQVSQTILFIVGSLY